MDDRWKTIRIRLEVYKILERLSEVEHRSLANMAQECILYYLSKKHKDIKIIG